jgi:hypothetical protein
MAVSISEVLEAARANIASFTDVNVSLGTPVDSEPGLYIFAYMFSEDSKIRNTPANLTEGQTDRSFVVNCLLMPSLSNGYVAIGEGLRGLTEQPILALGESTVRVSMSQLSAEVLARVFTSAGITLRLAIPFELNWTARL